MAKASLSEGIHYYYNEDGNMVLTALFLQEKGCCCGNGCLHCPYEYINVPEATREVLLRQREQQKQDEKRG
jgi:hypothetical protein